MTMTFVQKMSIVSVVINYLILSEEIYPISGIESMKFILYIFLYLKHINHVLQCCMFSPLNLACMFLNSFLNDKLNFA